MNIKSCHNNVIINHSKKLDLSTIDKKKKKKKRILYLSRAGEYPGENPSEGVQHEVLHVQGRVHLFGQPAPANPTVEPGIWAC